MLLQNALDGRAVALAGNVRARVSSMLEQHGASLELLDASIDGDEASAAWARDKAPLHALVFEPARPFDDGFLEDCWAAVSGVANGALIPSDEGGKVILIGPPQDSGPMAGPCRAALENLARTLSIEWARYGITATMIAPAATTTDEELAGLVAYLVSRAGDYFSGCRFDLSAALIRSS